MRHILRSRVEFDPAPSTTARELPGLSSSTGRESITFFPPAVGHVTLSSEAAVTDGNGIVLAAGQSPVYLCVEEQGECIQRAWNAIYSQGATAVSWIQALH